MRCLKKKKRLAYDCYVLYIKLYLCKYVRKEKFYYCCTLYRLLCYVNMYGHEKDKKMLNYCCILFYAILGIVLQLYLLIRILNHTKMVIFFTIYNLFHYISFYFKINFKFICYHQFTKYGIIKLQAQIWL